MTKHLAPLEVSENHTLHDTGLWLDVENELYHRLGGTGSHNITEIRDDIDLYLAGGEEDESKDHLILGSAFHDRLMRPEHFDKNYTVYPGKVRRGGKWDEFRFDNADKTILTKKMGDTLVPMHDHASSHEIWKQVMDTVNSSDTVVFEGSCWTRHPDSGMMCKVRPDVYISSGRVIDIKTASNPHWEDSGKYKKGFKYAIRNYNYYVQQAFYMDMLSYAGIPCNKFEFFVVGTSEPYDVKHYELPNSWVMDGRKVYETQLNRLKNKLIGG